MKRDLADLLQDRIDTMYDGKQAAFAQETGFSPAYVNHLLKRKVGTPGRDQRRVLANELGVSEIEILVLSGEIDAEDVGPRNEQLTRDERELVGLYREMPPSLRVPFLETIKQFREFGGAA